jgi:hypothetical protein
MRGLDSARSAELLDHSSPERTSHGDSPGRNRSQPKGRRGKSCPQSERLSADQAVTKVGGSCTPSSSHAILQVAATPTSSRRRSTRVDSAARPRDRPSRGASGTDRPPRRGGAPQGTPALLNTARLAHDTGRRRSARATAQTNEGLPGAQVPTERVRRSEHGRLFAQGALSGCRRLLLQNVEESRGCHRGIWVGAARGRCRRGSRWERLQLASNVAVTATVAVKLIPSSEVAVNVTVPTC